MKACVDGRSSQLTNLKTGISDSISQLGSANTTANGHGSSIGIDLDRVKLGQVNGKTLLELAVGGDISVTTTGSHELDVVLACEFDLRV